MAEKGGSVSGVSGGSSYRSRRAKCFSDRFAPLPDIIPLLVSLLFRSALFPFRVSFQFLWIRCSVIILYRTIFTWRKTHTENVYDKIYPFLLSYVEKVKEKKTWEEIENFVNSFGIEREEIVEFKSIFDSSRYLDRLSRYEDSKFGAENMNEFATHWSTFFPRNACDAFF